MQKGELFTSSHIDFNIAYTFIFIWEKIHLYRDRFCQLRNIVNKLNQGMFTEPAQQCCIRLLRLIADIRRHIYKETTENKSKFKKSCLVYKNAFEPGRHI